MKKTKILIPSALVSLIAIGTLSGCGKQEEKDERLFGFSISMLSGRNQIELDSSSPEKLVVNDNGVKTDGRSYQFKSDNPEVATVNSDGTIVPHAEGSVNFSCTELSEGLSSPLPFTVKVVKSAQNQEGGYNFSAQADTKKRTEILAALEKYAMDKKLTGITLFDNGGYVKYADRVKLPTTKYITGYGFGLLREGSLSGHLPKADVTEPDFYHTAISQDPLTINALNAQGSQVSDLSSYITSSYWGNRMNATKNGYEWYPVLAKDKIYRPSVDADGKVTFAEELSDNIRPIPMEAPNGLNLYKKWRIYLKTGESDGLTYRYKGTSAAEILGDSAKAGALSEDERKALEGLTTLENRKITLDDYAYSYKFILTGKNGQCRGAEMAGDTTYGIKGAQKFYNSTRDVKTMAKVDSAWNDFLAGGGLKTGKDEKGQEYIELELVNSIDDFTAMYSLSSSLVSPMPEDFITGIGCLKEPKGSSYVPMFRAGEKIGSFNDSGDNGILDYVISCGPYYLSTWVKRKQIIFTRNDSWFERVKDKSIYNIPGIVNEVIDSSTDIEATWKSFTDGELDVAGVPSQKIDSEKATALETKGDSTFKLNVNSCTQEDWDKYNEKIWHNSGRAWDVKPWMSNSNFLNGLFFSINRPEFAAKRGVQPSINYFSDAYLDDPINGHSYNETEEHKAAVANYHTIRNGNDNYGYDYDRAVSYFRSAVSELTKSGAMQRSSDPKNPNVYKIHIRWMYQTDINEYGNDIKQYFETAFNDPAVSGGTIKLEVEQEAVTNWEEVYDKWMMVGKYDLAFGAISGNTYNPLNFLEVLKSDNSSTFTLNYGADTALVDEIHPIIYDNKKWSFDALWESADHGGIVQNGVKIKPVEKCYRGMDLTLSDRQPTNDLFNGYYTEIPIQFANVPGVEYKFSSLKIYIPGYGYYPLEKSAHLNDDKTKIVVEVSPADAKEIDEIIYETDIKPDEVNILKDHPEYKHPFLSSVYNNFWSYEFYFTMKLSENAPVSETYCEVKSTKNDK